MVSLKLQYKGDVRRLSDLPITVGELKARAITLYQVRNPSFQYEDEEGDEITVQSQTEYEEVLRLLKGGPMTLKVIESSDLYSLGPSCLLDGSVHIANLPLLESQLSTSVIEEEEPAVKVEPVKEAPKVPEVMSQYFDALDLMNSVREIMQAELAHKGADAAFGQLETFPQMCIVCCSPSINGVMYRCLTCQAFNLCGSCEELCAHPHPLYKIRKLSQLQQLEEDLKQSQAIQPKIEPVKPQEPPVQFQVPKKPVAENRSNIEKVVEKMNELGFTDRASILEALRKTRYDVNEAVNYLLAK